MKNIALCFDHGRDRSGSAGVKNASALVALLQSDADQIVWSRPDNDAISPHHFPRRHRRSEARGRARASVIEAYEFLMDRWEPGDRLFVFGSGHGAYCARALTHLLGTVGILRGPDSARWRAADLTEYVLSAYAIPRTPRSTSDWRRVGRLAARLAGRSDIAVEVEFLGLWDTVAVPGLPRPDTPDPLPNVTAARHAIAIDGGYGPFDVQPLAPAGDSVEEVWFRGAHDDVAGGQNACTPLSQIALDWVLDGAVNAGAVPQPSNRLAPGAADALAEGAHTMSFRKVPVDAAVHASVERYLRTHPSYWRRLPARVTWADPDWEARSERLMDTASSADAVPELVGAS
ncbi:MAG: phospholipase effector Tle1 domain-containing protein [Mycobacterium sp.]